jgi:hypothetical protein
MGRGTGICQENEGGRKRSGSMSWCCETATMVENQIMEIEGNQATCDYKGTWGIGMDGAINCPLFEIDGRNCLNFH